jgi:hypothetical protein
VVVALEVQLEAFPPQTAVLELWGKEILVVMA